MKLHLGCGSKYLQGYKHIDYSNYDHIDWNSQIDKLPFIDDESIFEIYCSHALEYFDYIQSKEVLCEWRRCLKFGGILRISVPDFDKLLEVYKLSNFNIDKIIGPLFGRWETKGKKLLHHKTVFNKKKLEEILSTCGYGNFKYWDPVHHFGIEENSFDDCSKAYYPHMDFKNGFSISINIIAEKI